MKTRMHANFGRIIAKGLKHDLPIGKQVARFEGDGDRATKRWGDEVLKRGSFRRLARLGGQVQHVFQCSVGSGSKQWKIETD